MNDAGSITAAFDLITAKRLLIFDFDGTLADTSPLHAEAFKDVLCPLGVQADYALLAGLRTQDALLLALRTAGIDEKGLDLGTLVRAKQIRARELISQRLEPIPAVDKFLSWARRRCRLAICSSGSRGSIGLALEKLGYANWFDPIICADDVVQAKPDPEGYLKVLQLTGVNATEALVFEDSSTGVEAALRAGIETVDVTTTPFDSFDVVRGTRPSGP